MELVPIRLDLLLKRMFWEYQHEGRIFGLPKNRFFRGDPTLDTSVAFQGHRASTPLGPAAGPHDQMLQNIVLAWLGGSRAIELKTVQVLDDLKVPRPCIHAANIGYNVEWSQELKLDVSLREYVGAAMSLEIVKASHLLGDDYPAGKQETTLDMSVGYSLEGIRSVPVSRWITQMKNARVIIDELRGHLTGSLARYRDLPFPVKVSDSITLSTFHGCPAEEIEKICEFLLSELDVNVCVKMNPTLLGRPQLEHLLYDVMGYREIRLHQEAFDKDLRFDESLGLLRRLDGVARLCDKHLAVKFSNTLVIENHEKFFSDKLMYLSGPPLHVLTLNLVKRFREHVGHAFPVSFSAGVDAQNFPDMVAMDMAPVTTCTDLLRPGGYARLSRYMENLETRMHSMDATSRTEFILRRCGKGLEAITTVVERVFPREQRGAARARLEQWWFTRQPSLRRALQEVSETLLPAHEADLEALLAAEAGVLNTEPIVEQETGDPRYAAARNQGVPVQMGARLYLYDCLNCDKCVPICPNDANFIYEMEPVETVYRDYRVQGGQLVEEEEETLRIDKAHQIANYADFCNECGHCAVHCPQQGDPQAEKPRFFGSLETYRRAGHMGFYVEYGERRRTIYGTLGERSYRLSVEDDMASLDDGVLEVHLEYSTNRILNWSHRPAQYVEGHVLRMGSYLQLKYLLQGISNPKHINYVNIAAVGA